MKTKFTLFFFGADTELDTKVHDVDNGRRVIIELYLELDNTSLAQLGQVDGKSKGS